VAIFENTRFEPGFQLSADPRGRLHFRQECLMIDPIERPNILIPLSTTHRQTT
jgi:hypothetical protein